MSDLDLTVPLAMRSEFTSALEADDWGEPTETTVEQFAVRRIDEDAYMFTSDDRRDAEVWLRRLREHGHDVELVRSTISRRCFTRFSEWETVR